MVDYNYSSSSPRQIVNSVLQNGVVLLRAAIAPDQIKRIKSNLETIYSMHQRLISGDAKAVAFFADWDAALETLKGGDVVEPPYEKKFGQNESIYSFLDDPKFKEICALIFSGGKYYRTGTDNLMTVGARSQKTANATRGIDLHTDGMYFNDSRYGLTIWFPLDVCGRDAPGLEVVLAGHKEVREYTSFDQHRPAPPEPKWNWHHYRDGAFAEEQLRQHFQPNRWFAPEMSPGDVMILSNWSLHGSHRTAGMTRSRSAVQVRVEGYDFDPADTLDRLPIMIWLRHAVRTARAAAGRMRQGGRSKA